MTSTTRVDSLNSTEMATTTRGDSLNSTDMATTTRDDSLEYLQRWQLLLEGIV
jgi:hypothetical protein